MRNSKKLKQFTALFALTACLFTGCSGNSSDTSKSNEDTKGKNESTEKVEITPVPTLDSTIYTDNLMGIYIGENQSQIGLGLEPDSVKQVIGKADKVEKNKGTKGKSKKTATQSWYYKDLDTTINFEKSGKVYTVSSIEGGKKAATLKTGGGITVGATKQEVLDAYKDLLTDGKSEKKEQIVIENNGYSQLIFELDGDTVSGIVMELCQ